MDENGRMRVAFFYPSGSMWKSITPETIWTSSRGLTGSELACFMYAIGLSELGHGVTIFSKFDKPGNIGNVVCCPYPEWQSIYRDQHWDALCSWMTPDPLLIAQPSQFRLFNQQVSDFNLCPRGWEEHVDMLAPLSSSHARYMEPMTPFPRSKWRVMNNGVDLEKFRPGKKEPGKMIWASSHDRGLHWLLEAFPRIRARVPQANLHIFYDFDGMKRFCGVLEEEPSGIMRELGFRSRYSAEALRRLDGHGVHVHRSVSRERIQDEMSTSEVLAYPCDPVHYTETFGVTVLEACATGTVPVLCAADAFGELWGAAAPHVPPPYREHKEEYLDMVCDILLSEERRRRHASDCVEHAKKFAWGPLCAALEDCLRTRGSSGLPEVDW